MSKKDIWIEEDTLYYTDHQSINTANLKVLKYAYVQILAEVYEDISPEMNAHLGRVPKWSLAELLPLTFPE